MRHSNKFLVIGLLASIHPTADAQENWKNVRKAENQEFYSIISEEASVSESLDKRVFRNTVKMIDRKNMDVERAHPAVALTPSASKPVFVTNGYRSADHDPDMLEFSKEFRFARLAMHSRPYYKIPVVTKPDNYEKAFSSTLSPRSAISEADEIKNSIDRAFAQTTLKSRKRTSGVQTDDVEDALNLTADDVKGLSATETGNELFNTRLRPTKRKGFFDVLKEVFSGK